MIDADTMEHMYLIKWKNYPHSANTWEPKQNLNSPDLMRKFDAKKKKDATALAVKKASTGQTKATRTKQAKAVKPVKAAKAVKKAPGRRGRPRKVRA